jgi:hypothetical protein
MGSTPYVSPLLRLGARLSMRSGIEAGIDGFWVPGATVDRAPGSLTVSLLGAQLGAGYSVRTSKVAVGVNAIVAAGALHAVSSGYPIESTSVDRPWLAFGVGAYLHRHVGDRLILEGGVDALVPVRRHRFVLDPTQESVFRTAAVGGSLWLGLRWSIL